MEIRCRLLELVGHDFEFAIFELERGIRGLSEGRVDYRGELREVGAPGVVRGECVVP
jgi:hypothetical protein